MLKKTSLKAVTTALSCSVAFLCAATIGITDASAATFGSISRIYAFGDSYSDNGASLRITTAAVKAGVPGAFIFPRFNSLYDADGRWMNGPGLAAVEVLAKKENLQLTDYAVGGGKSGNGNLSSWLDAYKNTGLFGQIEQYKAEVSGVADANALHFIFISTADILEKFFTNQPGSFESLASKAVDNMVEGVSKLARLGAKQFFVVNSTDLAVLPLFKDNPEGAAKFTDTINQLLPAKLDTIGKQLDIEVALYDHVAISDKIRTNPTQYGFTNVNDACQLLYTSAGLQPACSTPDAYYFWDEIHPSRRVHEIIGEDMAVYLDTQKAASVPEPSTVVAVVIGAGLVGLRRRRVNYLSRRQSA